MMLSNFDVKEGKIYRRLTISNHMKIAGALYDLNAGELLARLTCPALAISCHRDPANPAEREWQSYRNEALARVKETAPLVRVQVMEDTIHDVPIQRPNELAAAIRSFVDQSR
jgi:pimeloyl-ACP methyl ester carboxylesterase